MRVLWLDNDVAEAELFAQPLTDAGFGVEIVSTVTAAHEALVGNTYDLLILDAMIPTKSHEEELLYPPERTDSGLKTGLVFYERVRDELRASGTRVLVLTVRLDAAIQREFEAAGLAGRAFATKVAVRNPQELLARVRLALAEPRGAT